MTPLVALEGIRVQFPAGRRTLTAVEDVSLHVDPGETLALVGESGSGKSTIGNVIAGLQRPTAGAIRFRGKLLDKATERSARRGVQIIFQDPFGALDPRMPVSAIIAEPLRIQRVGTSRERAARAADLVDQVGLPRDALNRYPHEFSGGQRQRIAIARSLASQPDLIVADEPLSALDVSIQSQTRSCGGQSPRRPDCGAVSWSPGRGGAAGGVVRHAVAPLHRGAAGGDAAHWASPSPGGRYSW